MLLPIAMHCFGRQDPCHTRRCTLRFADGSRLICVLQWWSAHRLLSQLFCCVQKAARGRSGCLSDIRESALYGAKAIGLSSTRGQGISGAALVPEGALEPEETGAAGGRPLDASPFDFPVVGLLIEVDRTRLPVWGV